MSFAVYLHQIVPGRLIKEVEWDGHEARVFKCEAVLVHGSGQLQASTTLPLGKKTLLPIV